MTLYQQNQETGVLDACMSFQMNQSMCLLLKIRAHMFSFFDDVVVLNALWVAYVPSAVTKRWTDPEADCISAKDKGE